ncbi:hypothetical protein ES703_78323 [subsurface metagenome]
MCKPGEEAYILVNVPEDLSTDGTSKVKYVLIDKCIAPLVEALQRGGIDMRGSCCGHGQGAGTIHLQDGRVLVIMDYEKFDKCQDVIHALQLGGGG